MNGTPPDGPADRGRRSTTSRGTGAAGPAGRATPPPRRAASDRPVRQPQTSPATSRAAQGKRSAPARTSLVPTSPAPTSPARTSPAATGSNRRGATSFNRRGATAAPRLARSNREATERANRGMRLGRPGRRLSIGFGVVCVLLLVVTGRLVQLQGVGVSDYAAAATREHVRTETLHAARGSIVDRNGVVLAYTADAKDVIVDPSLINCTYQDAVKDQCHPQDHLPLALKLSELTGAATDQILAGLALTKSRYAVIAQAVPPVQAQQVDALKINGIFVEPTTQRLYPGGTTASNIVGLVHSDGTGAAGIEQKYNTLLQGKNGTYTFNLTATGGMNPAGTTRRTAAVNGSTLHLTIAQDLQFVVQRDLDAAVKKLRAKSGNVVVLDAKTGQVLAMAGSETQKFNPQNTSTYPKLSADSAIQNPYEPGSVSKVLTFTAALQKGIITPSTVLTVPDRLKINDVTIHDDWYHNPLHLTATGIIAESSNIGTLKIAQKVGPTTFMDYVKAYGLGQTTGIELPGEDTGRVIPQSQWSSSTYANFPIGQGYVLTPLQLASVYQTIANDGVRVPPRIVAEVTNPDGTVVATKQPAGIRVTSAATARTMRTMLESVLLKGGTAAKSKLMGYRVAGKTGTAQQIDKTGHYSRSVYWDSFAGIVPADNPQFVVAVMINAPADGLFGSQTAAPLFHEIAAYQVQHAGILPSASPSKFVPLQVK